MKRLWTLEDIKGFIKRYSTGIDEAKCNQIIEQSTSKNVYKISWTLAQTGTTTIDGRFCQSCDAYVGDKTWNSFRQMS